MTYCVAIKLNAGLVFLSDSRTNAGLDNISTFRKMIVYERPGDRFMVLLSAGNLSITQSVQCGSRACDTSTWSMRKPRLRRNAISR